MTMEVPMKHITHIIVIFFVFVIQGCTSLPEYETIIAKDNSTIFHDLKLNKKISEDISISIRRINTSGDSNQRPTVEQIRLDDHPPFPLGTFIDYDFDIEHTSASLELGGLNFDDLYLTGVAEIREVKLHFVASNDINNTQTSNSRTRFLALGFVADYYLTDHVFISTEVSTNIVSHSLLSAELEYDTTYLGLHYATNSTHTFALGYRQTDVFKDSYLSSNIEVKASGISLGYTLNW